MARSPPVDRALELERSACKEESRKHTERNKAGESVLRCGPHSVLKKTYGTLPDRQNEYAWRVRCFIPNGGDSDLKGSFHTPVKHRTAPQRSNLICISRTLLPMSACTERKLPRGKRSAVPDLLRFRGGGCRPKVIA